jgi:hypothetical protein
MRSSLFFDASLAILFLPAGLLNLFLRSTLGIFLRSALGLGLRLGLRFLLFDSLFLLLAKLLERRQDRVLMYLWHVAPCERLRSTAMHPYVTYIQVRAAGTTILPPAERVKPWCGAAALERRGERLSEPL